jgi:hypothetical protein
MIIDLVCPCCPFQFSAPAAADAVHILDRMIEDGPWLALGEGDTFEDMVVRAVNTRGAIRCPDCREALIVNHEEPSQFREDLLVCS